ncbi:unnamed protein product [Oppiella nova]|uniref:PLAC domain-containing protein n=1 Tax=Oppiella nova TaxID=334625 RepID=A0A7R9MJ97_9ACAR|nr:unnamed protein product [Oppiella nova]CAG2178408.1 unnamed protein product [Oppiella nova]
MSTSDEDRTVERHNFGPNNYDFGKVVKNSEERSDRSHDISKMGSNGFMNKKQILMRSKPKRAFNLQKDSVLNEESYSAESPVISGDRRMDTFEVNYGNENKEVSDHVINKYEDNSEENYRSQPIKDESLIRLETVLEDLRKLTKSQSISSDAFSNNRHNKSENNYNLLINALVSRNGKPEHLKFDWLTTDWSICDQPCNGTEYQVRDIQCLVIYENISKTIDNMFCTDAGLIAPKTIRSCRQSDCPFWQTSQWSDCNQCIDLRTGMQYREVSCSLNNGTILDHNECQSQDKPITQKQCINDLCEATWVTGQWTHCTAKCNEEGYQWRTIECVWFNSGQSAGNACNDKTKPDVVKSCSNDSCNPSNECVDTSKHCHLAKSLNMCRIAHYKHQCCQSCQSYP